MIVRTLLVLVALAQALNAVAAVNMDDKAKVLKTVPTAHAGVAEVTCDDTAGWTFDATASEDAGRDVLTVKLTSPTNALPPRFGVFFRVSGKGVRNVWTADFTRDGSHLRPQLWWRGTAQQKAHLSNDMPLAVGYDEAGVSRAAIACSEAFECVIYGLYADDRTCEAVGRCEFFTETAASRKEYVVKVLFDRRGKVWSDVVRESADWISSVNGFAAADVPEAAYDPLYSTWYAFLQDVHADELEREAKLAASLGMKTMILDDGWQKNESVDFYSATGDWMPVTNRFPDIKAHVDAVHRAGLKYMAWLSVPHCGDETKAWNLFKDKMLRIRGKKTSPGRVGVLDPRFPEVREYLIRTYERAVGEWGFDGLKLDFIDSFTFRDPDPAPAEDFRGRDYRSLPEAVNRLMTDVNRRLKAIRPDVLIEFRQPYIGPAVRQYGNMLRAADCPADLTANRRRICDLRLTSGRTAVHSDMLVWSKDETPEGAAQSILNVLFSTIQYSMILEGLRDDHRAVIRHWLDFSQRHREALLKGAFRPHHPENGYTWVESESASERIIAVYSGDACAKAGTLDREVYLINATSSPFVLVELEGVPAKVEFLDVVGRPVGEAKPTAGLVRLAVPPSGYARIVPSAIAGSGGRPVPKPALLDRIHEGIDVYGIVHWGLNTYTDREWGYGDEDPRLLDPEAFDADQIVSACKDGGLQGLVVVAKHHDGFCLWPTRTTEHNITKSPFRGGKGDYVREMAEACSRHGMKFGVYVSPWDRNSADYGTAKYVETYHAQIKELLGGNYGEVFEMWFDGANGGDGYYGGAREKRIIPGGYYRFGDVFKFVRELQPKVCIFAGESDASDLRWPGNERGELDPDSRATIVSVGGFSKGEYGNSDYRYLINSGIPSGRFFRMCEADFPLRRGWFHHEKDKGFTKHAAYLMKCYLRTVGNGGMMNLGIAPNKGGRLDEEDVKALKGFGTIKNAFFAHEVIGDGKPFNVIVLEEDVSGGEQVDHWHLFDGETKCLASGRAIGRRRIRVFDKEIVPDRLNLRIGSAGPGLGQVSLRRYRVDPELIGLVMDSSVSSGETDTARWMTGAGNEKEETGK